jgi:hypothetical protein
VSDRFDRWWYDEGSGMTPADPSDIETHTRRVAEIAWSNGEYVASERHEAEIARLRVIRDLAQHVWDTIPAEYEGPGAEAHARALNTLGAALNPEVE